MKRLMPFVAVCTAICLGCNQKEQKDKQKELPPAVISLNDTTIHLGDIPLEHPIDSVDVPFTNLGQGPLVILASETSCHCTSVSYDQRPIPPEGVSCVRIIYDGSGRLPEYFRKIVRLYTNDIRHSIVTLTIDGRLSPSQR